MPKPRDTAGARRPSRRRLILVTAAMCGVATVLAVLAFDRLPSTIGDNAEFAILAKAVAAGKGMRYINHPDMRAATKYPPGFPVLLAGWIGLFGDSIVAMKALVVACFVGTVGTAFILARRVLDEQLGIVAAMIVATSFVVLTYSYQILSDIPYALFSLIALVVLMDDRAGRRTVVIGIGLCIWAYLVRTAAASLVIAAAVVLFTKGRKRESVLLICVLVAVSLLWTARNYGLAGEGSRYTRVLLQANPYEPDLGRVTVAGMMKRGVVNLGSYLGGLLEVTLFPTLLTTGEGLRAMPLRALISGLILLPIVVGGYVLRKKALLLDVYLVAYVVVYLAWPEVWTSDRFMVPVTPVAAVLFLAGMGKIFRYFEVKRLALVITCVALVASNVPSLATFIGRERGYSPGWYNYIQTAAWVRDHTDADAVVLCRKPFLFYVFSNRLTIGYPFTQDAGTMRAYLLESRPDYAVFEDYGSGVSATAFYIMPALDEIPGSYVPVFSTEEPVNTVMELNLPSEEVPK